MREIGRLEGCKGLGGWYQAKGMNESERKGFSRRMERGG